MRGGAKEGGRGGRSPSPSRRFSRAASSQPANAAPATIRRLDGTTITTAKAESFARETLAAAHVTGAQIAVLDRGSLVWSAAFGLRRREPPSPMDRETTTWAASITKGVFATYVMQLVERREFSLESRSRSSFRKRWIITRPIGRPPPSSCATAAGRR